MALEPELEINMTAIEFIESKFKYHGPMTYDVDKHKWNVDPLTSTDHGVYAILLDRNIMKFGKADSKRGGLGRRINDYRWHSPKRVGVDPTVTLWHRIMTGPLRDQILDLYYWETPIRRIHDKYLNEEIVLSSAREYERILSDMAKAEGHALLLSGQN